MKVLKKKWYELATLVIALIALLISLQANMIGRSQIAPKVILIEAELVKGLPEASNDNGHFCFRDPNREEPPFLVCPSELFCIHQFRIANLGGARTSIIDFEATISYLDQKILLKGEGTSFASDFASNKEQDNNFSGVTISLMPSKASVYLSPDYNPNSFIPDSILSTDLLQLPDQIDEYSVVDIFAKSTISNITNLNVPPFSLYSEQEPYPYLSINISYSFLFSSGKRLVTPDIACLFVTQ